MKKIVLFVITFIVFSTTLNVKAEIGYCPDWTNADDQVHWINDMSFPERLELYKKECNPTRLCVYSDPESEHELERKYMTFLAKDNYGGVNETGWNLFLYEDYKYPHMLGHNTGNEGGHYYLSPLHDSANDKTISREEEEEEIFKKMDACPAEMYYICEKIDFGEDSKYKNIGGCFYSFNPIQDVEKEISTNPTVSHIKSSGYITGIWPLNLDESINPGDILKEVTTYMSINRTEELTVSASENLTENSKAKVTDKKDKELTVTNADKYLETFVNKNEENYPRYLIKKANSNKYEYVNSLNDENGQKIKYEKLYINGKYINVLFQLGNKEKYQYCEDLIGGKDEGFIGFLKNNVFRIIWISVPIILILLTSIDFMRVVFSDNKDGFKDSFKKFAKRVIVSVLIFLTPTIIIFLSNLIVSDEYNVDDCVKSINEISTETTN